MRRILRVAELSIGDVLIIEAYPEISMRYKVLSRDSYCCKVTRMDMGDWEHLVDFIGPLAYFTDEDLEEWVFYLDPAYIFNKELKELLD